MCAEGTFLLLNPFSSKINYASLWYILFSFEDQPPSSLFRNARDALILFIKVTGVNVSQLLRTTIEIVTM